MDDTIFLATWDDTWSTGKSGTLSNLCVILIKWEYISVCFEKAIGRCLGQRIYVSTKTTFLPKNQVVWKWARRPQTFPSVVSYPNFSDSSSSSRSMISMQRAGNHLGPIPEPSLRLTSPRSLLSVKIQQSNTEWCIRTLFIVWHVIVWHDDGDDNNNASHS
jgi:hypothetical protein